MSLHCAREECRVCFVESELGDGASAGAGAWCLVPEEVPFDDTFKENGGLRQVAKAKSVP